ncbi:hypothetical protein EHV15_35870 [Paenibacillus oralis]|uniref:MarR family transcriptional regulator n=1 Tax=Paenibacillus oralis TaxID=2490856 RepID=A0A3P3TA70_9BACL|nr:hypothetical protein [Paenibacillus oralis]RRJ54951.1 hypothetical protein EHV15_35870 [Paenibacillus oralis]
MNEKQLKVLSFLGTSPEKFFRPTIIALRSYPEKGTSWGYDRGSGFISPVCKKLVEAGYVERRDPGEYRITLSGVKALVTALEPPKS